MRLKLLIIFTFVLNTIFGQTIDIDFSGYGNVQAVSGSGPFYNLTIGGFSGSPRFQPDGLWIASDVTVGKVVWIDCARFVITAVGATTINSMIVTVQVPPADWALGITAPLAGQRVAILTEDNGIPTSIPQTGDGNGGNLTGIDNSLYSCILSHYMKAILSYSAAPFTITGSVEIGAVATPGNVALDLEQQGASTGQVLKWDGTNWTPANDLNGGSGAAIDSVIIRSNTNGIEVKVNTTASSYTLVTPLALSGAGAMLNQVLKWNGTDWVPDYDLSSITDLSVTNRTSTGLDIASSDGIDASVPAATTSLAGLMVATDKTKLNFITVTQNVDLDAIEAASHAAVTLGAGSPKLTLLGQQLTLTDVDDADASITNENLTISDGTDTENLGGQTLIVAGSGGMVVNYTPIDNTLNLSFNEADSDVSNEGILTVTTATGNSSGILSNTVGATAVIIQGTAGILVTESGSTITLTAADNSNSNEGNLSVGAGTSTTSIINSNTSGSGVITLVAGSNITLSENVGTNEITISSTGGAGTTDLGVNNRTSTTLDITSSTGLPATVPSATTTLAGLFSGADKTKLDSDTDQSPTNELQTISVVSNTTTLSNAGGSMTIAGAGINVVSTSGSTIIVTGTEIDGLITNEGSLTVAAGTSTTSIINSNTSGSTDVTITAGAGLTISETGNVITLVNSDPDQSITNENLTISDGTDTENMGGQTLIVSGVGGMVVNYTPVDNTLYLSYNESDSDISNEGVLTVTTATGNSSGIQSNTSGASPVIIQGTAGILVTESGNTITLTAADNSNSNEGNLAVGAGGANTATITSNTSGSGVIEIIGSSNISVTDNIVGNEIALENILTNGQVYIGNASNIAQARTLSGDLTTTNSGVVTVDQIDNTPVTATGASTGQVLKWDGSAWVPSADNTGGAGSTDLSVSNVTATTLDVVSSSGIDATLPAATTTLAGVMPAADKVKSNFITITQSVDLDALEAASHAAVTVTDNARVDLTLTGQNLQVDLLQNGATTGQVMKWNGTVWAPANDAGTTYTAGAGIDVTGTVITNIGDLSAANEGSLTVAAGTSTTSIINSNTTGQVGVTITAGTGLAIFEVGNTITLDNTDPDQSVTNELQTLSNTSNATTHTSTLSNSGGSIQLVEGTGITLATTGTGLDGVVTITNSGIITEVDGNINNEGSLTVGAGTGTTSIINSNTSGSTGVTVTASTGLSISEAGNVITLTNTDPDQSTTNELQTLSNTSNATSHTTTLSSTGGSVQLVEGTGIALATTGTGLDGIVTITNTGIITEVDGSVSNELQTVSNTSDATTHTLTLSNSGGSIQVAEGSGISLTTSGTGLNGVLTIASTSTGVTDLTITGTSSPLTVNSSTGTDYTVTAGAGISLTGTSGNMTIVNTGIITEVDGDISNEGSLTVAAGTGTTSVINSNTSGSTGVTLTAGSGLTISEVGNVITLVNSAPDQVLNLTGAGISSVSGTYPNLIVTSTEVDGSVSNELQTLSTVTNTVTLSNAGGSFTIAGAGTNSVSTSGSTITVTGNGISSTLANNNILIGNASNVATAVDPSGDADISNTGVILVDKIDNINVTATGATDGQLWRWNNGTSTWVPSDENTQQLVLTGTTNPQIELGDNSGFSGGAGAMLVVGDLGMVVTNSGGDIHVALPAVGTANNILTSNGSTWSSQPNPVQSITVNPTTGSAPFLRISDGLGNPSGGGTVQAVGNFPLDIVATGSGSFMTLITETGATTGDVIKFDGTDWSFAPDATGSGAADLTFTGASSPYTLNSSTGTDVTFAQGSGITLSRSSNELTVTAVDASTTNEVLTVTDGVNSEALGGQTLTVTGSGGAIVSYNPATNTLTVNAGSSSGGDNWGSQVVAIGAGLSGDGTAGMPLIATDASISNEGSLTVGAGSGTTSIINSNTSGSTGVTITASTGLSISEAGNVITLTNTDADQSTTNELQAIANTSNATSHTATLSLSGGSLQLAEGSGISLTTTGTGLDGVVTIASTSTGVTDLSFTGGSSPYTLNSSTGNDVTFAQGVGVTFTRTGDELLIDADDVSPSNEGSLTVVAGTSTTSLITSNTSGSSNITIEALSTSGLTLAESGNTITLTMVKVLREETFTATASQTAFTMAYSAPAVSGTAYPIRVFRNGVELDWVASAPSITQYTFSGTTLTTAANALNDKIRVNYFN